MQIIYNKNSSSKNNSSILIEDDSLNKSINLENKKINLIFIKF
jgi:hypothetical protein